nr:hypothetical protein [Tanacetum cinerariifolium]
MTKTVPTLEEYIKNARDEYGWIMVETEVLNLLKISGDLFSYETPLRMTFEEFKRLSSINDNLFDYEVKIPKPSYASCVKHQTNYRSKDFQGSFEVKGHYEESWGDANSKSEEILRTKVNDEECSPLANWRNLTSKMHENDLEVEEILKSDPYLDIYKIISLTRNDKGKTIKEKPEPQINNNDNMGSLKHYLVQKDPPYFVNEEEEKSKERKCMLLGIPYVKPPTYKIERFKVVKYSFEPLEEYVAINELEHDIWFRTEENVSNGYQDIFYKKDDEDRAMEGARWASAPPNFPA